MDRLLYRDPLLDAVVGAVDDVRAACSVDRQADRFGELAFAAADRSETCQERAGGTEPLDASVAAVDDVEVACGVGGDAGWFVELSVTASGAAELPEIFACR